MIKVVIQRFENQRRVVHALGGGGANPFGNGLDTSARNAGHGYKSGWVRDDTRLRRGLERQ